MLSGFERSVTIVVILDSCYAGSFVDGKKDLLSIRDAGGQLLQPGHFELLAASDGTTTLAKDGSTFTRKLVDGLSDDGTGKMKADAAGNRDDVTRLVSSS